MRLPGKGTREPASQRSQQPSEGRCRGQPSGLLTGAVVPSPARPRPTRTTQCPRVSPGLRPQRGHPWRPEQLGPPGPKLSSNLTPRGIGSTHHGDEAPVGLRSVFYWCVGLDGDPTFQHTSLGRPRHGHAVPSGVSLLGRETTDGHGIPTVCPLASCKGVSTDEEKETLTGSSSVLVPAVNLSPFAVAQGGRRHWPVISRCCRRRRPGWRRVRGGRLCRRRTVSAVWRWVPPGSARRGAGRP